MLPYFRVMINIEVFDVPHLHLSPVKPLCACHLSCIICHLSSVMYNLSPVICHLSRGICLLFLDGYYDTFKTQFMAFVTSFIPDVVLCKI